MIGEILLKQRQDIINTLLVLGKPQAIIYITNAEQFLLLKKKGYVLKG